MYYIQNSHHVHNVYLFIVLLSVLVSDPLASSQSHNHLTGNRNKNLVFGEIFLGERDKPLIITDYFLFNSEKKIIIHSFVFIGLITCHCTVFCCSMLSYFLLTRGFMPFSIIVPKF